MPPTISVIIPARNEEAYIENALTSVATQDFPLSEIECVVVDNASTDGTAAVVRAYAAGHPEPPILVVREETPGISRAKNRGACAARGGILIFLDADSRMTRCLAADVAASHAAGSPAGSIRIVADSTDPVERSFFALLELGKVLFGIRAQMLYCDRALFCELGGFCPDLQQAEDLEFLQRVQQHLRERDGSEVPHIRSSAIATSPRRLRGGHLRSRMIATFVRWLLATFNIGRKWPY